MTKKNGTVAKKSTANELRLLPLAIAGALSFVIGTTGGATGWYFFGSNSPRNAQKTGSDKPIIAVVVPNAEPSKAAEPSATAPTAQPSLTAAEPSPAAIVAAPAGELPVEGGDIALGGGKTGRALRREAVKPFAVAETEVTVAQFREFVEAVKDTNEALKNFKLPAGKDDEPVTNVTWDEAKAYCDWLGRKINAEVRLPTEAEWELAARGKQGFVYPWGNEWRSDGAASKETKGTLRAVKTTPINKSPFGAFDMAGNVWEWIGEQDDSAEAKKSAKPLYVLKGGSFEDDKEDISGQARFAIESDTRLPIIGFRYVVVRSDPARN